MLDRALPTVRCSVARRSRRYGSYVQPRWGGAVLGPTIWTLCRTLPFILTPLAPKSTSSSGFLPGLGGCIVPFHPARAVTVAKRREYEPIQTYTLYTKLVFQWCGVSHDLSIYYKMAIQCSSYGVETC